MDAKVRKENGIYFFLDAFFPAARVTARLLPGFSACCAGCQLKFEMACFSLPDFTKCYSLRVKSVRLL